MKHLINAEEVLAHEKADDPFVLLDCRFDLLRPEAPRQAYLEGHLPRAHYIDMERDLCQPKGTYGGNHPFQSPNVFKDLLESLGISNDTLVVVYDEGDLSAPARFLCQALQIGLENVWVLNGGYPAYIQAGGRLTSQEPDTPKEKGHIVIDLHPEALIDMAEVQKRLHDPESIIIDSRSRPRYLGQEEPVYLVAGHIPGAVNYYYADVLEDGFMKPKAFLAKHFQAVDPEKTVILSCGSGISACVNSLALMQLEIPHRLYNGSYSEWVQFPENPIQTGEAAQ